ncbi:CHAT domain-containing tetratricopeptide repeat protein [Streptomyces sp. P11-1]|uniref:tetratricopeptide repeat protein n=1 Tax=Streptomyces TaxID=1883 RepID=UPI0035DC6023
MNGGDAYRGDITRHPSAESIFAAWQRSSVGRRREAVDGPPPGAIALRCRYRHLADPVEPHRVPAPVTAELWDRALIAETEIDEAVHTGRFDRAAALCRELLDGPYDELTATNALIGSGDVHRARGQVEQAIEQYDLALRRADACGYRFGRLRALAGLGHVALNHHSVERARTVYGEAGELARSIGDPLYEANTLFGSAECAERSRDLEGAIEAHEQAHALYVEVASVTGQAHAAQRIGALYHRAGQLEVARAWLVGAAKAFELFDDPVGTVNVLESMGDLLLHLEETDQAEACYREAHAIARARGLAPAETHAVQNFARVARARHDWPTAVALLEKAAAAYREAGDLLGVCNALGKLAECRERLGDAAVRAQAVRDRVAAVFAIEEYRAAHRETVVQQEYRERYGPVYASALRAAVRAGAPESFVVVADGLAGRRLAGLATQEVPAGVSGRLSLLQYFSVGSDERLRAQRRPPGAGGMQLPPDMPRRERVSLLLGGAAIGATVREPARAAVEDLLAAVYLPPVDDGAALLAAVPGRCHLLQLVIDPDDPRLLHRLWRDEHGENRLDSVELSDACTGLLAIVQTDGPKHSALRPSDVTALRELLPEELRRALADAAVPRLLLVPASGLWLVPWGAVPVGPRRLLAESTEYVVCPSLLIQRVLAGRGPARPVDGPAHLWRNPRMEGLELAELQADERWTFDRPATASRVLTVLAADAHTVVVLCHGRPAVGPGHYLELEPGSWLLPANLLDGTPPQRLYLITCWGGGIPGQALTEPVTIGTLALVTGSVEVLATVGEYGDTPDGDQFAQWVLESLSTTDTPLSRAVHLASRRILALEDAWEWPLRDWAPLLPMGTFHH